ncbi:MAG: phage tail sheath C-terminal domain-containing protein [Hydrogenophaga sp.]|uniref:phage tail sheath C-terminal domain-containing protein n=1 Tax=Hydrogenophaga sp. TaxID=1904254 RepID=UPI003D9BA762
MSTTRRRPGLSFELAPTVASHPLRSDIACFVGTVARRRLAVPAGPQPLPAVLQRWLQSHQVHSVGGLPLARLRVALDGPARFAHSLLAQASSALERAALADFLDQHTGSSAQAPRWASLLKACRELSPLPEVLLDDLHQRELTPGRLLVGDELSAWERVQRLLNLPLQIDGFDAFDQLFAWDQRGVRDRNVRADDPVVATALGVALRAFFGEGGRRAWVVRTGDPSALYDTAVGRWAACFPQAGQSHGFDDDTDRCPQLPGVRRQVKLGMPVGLQGSASPPALSAADWVGLEHVYGLPDVSLVVLPDLLDACAQPLTSAVPPAEVASSLERFVDCVAEAPPETQAAGRRVAPPRLNARGLEVWRQLLLRALHLLDNPGRAHGRRDVQLIASLPLLGDGRDLPAPSQWVHWMARTPGWLVRDGHDTGTGGGALLSDHLQLAYPWLRTADSADTPGGIEAPEGSLAGVLARSALERGAYRSAATRPLLRYHDSTPVVPWSQVLQDAAWTPLGTLTLAERVCLLGPSPRGPQLLSDVSCSGDPRTRQAAVRRLLNVVVQAAQRAGDDFAFEPNGEHLWARVRNRLNDLMRALLSAGALSSDGTPFDVRCGRDTMQPSDIDSGRLIVRIELQPAQPVQRIVVVLNLREAGTAPVFANAA